MTGNSNLLKFPQYIFNFSLKNIYIVYREVYVQNILCIELRFSKHVKRQNSLK